MNQLLRKNIRSLFCLAALLFAGGARGNTAPALDAYYQDPLVRLVNAEIALNRLNRFIVGVDLRTPEQFVTWAKQRAAINARYAHAEDVEAVCLSDTHDLLRGCLAGCPDAMASICEILAEIPNNDLRAVVERYRVIARLRTIPIELKFRSLQGEEIDLSKMRGKVILLDMGGVTVCGACLREEPFVKAAYDKYHAQGFEVISLLADGKGTRAKVLTHLKEHKLEWPHYFDDSYPSYRQPLVKQFNPSERAPEYFLFNREGLLVEYSGGSASSLQVAVRRQLGLSEEMPGDNEFPLGRLDLRRWNLEIPAAFAPIPPSS